MTLFRVLMLTVGHDSTPKCICMLCMTLFRVLILTVGHDSLMCVCVCVWSMKYRERKSSHAYQEVKLGTSTKVQSHACSSSYNVHAQLYWSLLILEKNYKHVPPDTYSVCMHVLLNRPGNNSNGSAIHVVH